ncbi:MAG: hypothetical protein ACREHV_17880 [Rhizomicrobium sp.]
MSPHLFKFIAIIVGLAFLSGCNPHRPSPPQPVAQKRPPAVAAHFRPMALPTGRFQIFFSPHERTDTFLLDTATGRVWRLIQKTGVQGQPSVWEHMDRLDTNADDYVFTQEHQPARR